MVTSAGSMVLPDLEDCTNRVCSTSMPAMIVRTRTGETESSVRNLMRFESTELYLVMVIGAWVDPPWPISTTVFMPRSIISSAKAWISSMGYGGSLASEVQPM